MSSTSHLRWAFRGTVPADPGTVGTTATSAPGAACPERFEDWAARVFTRHDEALTALASQVAAMRGVYGDPVRFALGAIPRRLCHEAFVRAMVQDAGSASRVGLRLALLDYARVAADRGSARLTCAAVGDDRRLHRCAEALTDLAATIGLYLYAITGIDLGGQR